MGRARKKRTAPIYEEKCLEGYNKDRDSVDNYSVGFIDPSLYRTRYSLSNVEISLIDKDMNIETVL
jgi:hypothetical protein